MEEAHSPSLVHSTAVPSEAQREAGISRALFRTVFGVNVLVATADDHIRLKSYATNGTVS